MTRPWDTRPWSQCPTCGPQQITRESFTKGTDPHNVEHLTCGHRVVWMENDYATIIGGRK